MTVGPLQYIGPPPANPGDVATQTFLQNLAVSASLTQAQVNTLITNGFAAPTYAPLTYLSEAVAGTIGPNTSPLATQAYVNAGNALNVPLTAINNPNGGGVVGLSSSGMVSATQFNVPPTQRWPQAYFSPSAYNTRTVSATTTETNVYSMTVNPSLTGNYKLFVTGLAQSTAATDTQYPIVRVRQGGTSAITGQIVAVGYGTAESYQALPPGGSSAQSQFSSTSTTASSYTVIPGWTGVGGATMNGNYLEAPFTGTATLSASAVFSGATSGNGTSIEIVNSSGTVIATGSSVNGNSGTCTVSTSASVTQGAQYTINGKESVGKGGVQGSWTSGTFSIGSALVVNDGEVQILPLNFDQQTPIASGTSTTVYVNVISSGSGSVSLLAANPKLSVVAVPS